MGTGTIKYPLFGVCIVFMFLGAFAGVVSAKTIYVPDNYDLG